MNSISMDSKILSNLLNSIAPAASKAWHVRDTKGIFVKWMVVHYSVLTAKVLSKFAYKIEFQINK